MIDNWGISCEIALRWMPLDLTNDTSTLVQAMAWSRQASSHYLSQCWPRSMSPYGVTKPQWVKYIYLEKTLNRAPGNTDVSQYAWWMSVEWRNVNDARLDKMQDQKWSCVSQIFFSKGLFPHNISLVYATGNSSMTERCFYNDENFVRPRGLIQYEDAILPGQEFPQSS